MLNFHSFVEPLPSLAISPFFKSTGLVLQSSFLSWITSGISYAEIRIAASSSDISPSYPPVWNIVLTAIVGKTPTDVPNRHDEVKAPLRWWRKWRWSNPDSSARSTCIQKARKMLPKIQPFVWVRDFLLKSVTPDFLLIRFPSFSSNSSDPSLRSPDDPAPWKPWKGDSGDFTLGNTEKDVGNQGFSVRKMIWPRLVAFSDLRIYVQEVTRQNLSFCGGGHVSFWFILIHFAMKKTWRMMVLPWVLRGFY